MYSGIVFSNTLTSCISIHAGISYTIKIRGGGKGAISKNWCQKWAPCVAVSRKAHIKSNRWFETNSPSIPFHLLVAAVRRSSGRDPATPDNPRQLRQTVAEIAAHPPINQGNPRDPARRIVDPRERSRRCDPIRFCIWRCLPRSSLFFG